MSVFKLGKHALCAGLLFSIASAAQADGPGVTLSVHCGASSGLNSIGAALKVLKHSETSGPSTINVSGACNEDVVIQSMDRVTLNAVKGASINDPSQGTNVTVVIDDSRSVAINNFVINGYAAGTSGNDVVDCQDASVCFFNGDTIQNGPAGAGIGVWSGSYLDIEGGFLQNNSSWGGLVVFRSAKARVNGVTSQRNWRGAVVAEGGHLQLINSTITSNSDVGIELRQGAALICQSCAVTGNGSVGVNVEESSVTTFHGNASVTGNAGAGINLSDLSSASFDGTESVNNNGGQGDLVCNPKYTTTAGLPGGGGSTNCTGQAPFSTIVGLTNAHVDPASGNTLVSAFILTDSTDPNCLLTLSESNNAVPGMVTFCGVRTPFLYGGKPGVLIHVLFPAPVVNPLVLSLTVHQNGAKIYGQPVLCRPVDGCN